MAKLFVEDLAVRGKRVLVRVDFNVPLNEDGEITDDRRIQATLPTIRCLIDGGARVILMSHLGRPKGERRPEFSLEPVAFRLGELLRKEVALAEDCVGPAVQQKLQGLGDGGVLLLENLRFHKEETDNEPAFAEQLGSLGELYVNDAFGTAHRAHASTDGAPRHFKQRAAGYLMKKELDYLGGALEKPGRPYVAIIGGAKVSGKIKVVRALLHKVDQLLVGGGMAYTFFKAMGREIGKSLVEEERIDIAREVLEESKSPHAAELLLPLDCVAADRFDNDADRLTVDADNIPADRDCLDIGPKTIELYSNVIREAKTVVWNGPMGVFEMSNFAKGTDAVALALVECTASGGVTVIGGGDSAAAISQAGLADKVSHVSTGGGASLKFIEGEKLPGVEALTDV